MKIKLFFFFSFVIAAFSSCYYDNYEELHPTLTGSNCDTAKVMSYSNDIVPILNASCGTNNSCHGTTNTSTIDLTTYAGVNNTVINGLLYSAVIWDGNASNMPKGSASKIPVCDITKIKKWIDAGAQNN